MTALTIRKTATQPTRMKRLHESRERSVIMKRAWKYPNRLSSKEKAMR
jgi:hypothetical protein